MDVKKPVRLPAHVRPERYRITLRPDLVGFSFWGQEEIDLFIDRDSREITLHCVELEIEEAQYQKDGLVWSASVSYDEARETATLTFPQKVVAGSGKLKLTFRGVLNDKMRGFYRSKYEAEGETRYLAVTQFESTDARRAFPCFDEPHQKAVFEVTLMIPPDLSVISNTVETEVWEHEEGLRAVRFAPTPKMSTYLLAFLVGDFESIEAKTKAGVTVRVFTTRGKKNQAEFALDVAIRGLDFYSHYFDIAYPLPVLDLVAIPDFAAGAMENWGAVTYRESALLVDEKLSSVGNKQRVALVIAHELAHQWFGNLVTMEWWTHLWLNEGFASYMEYVCVDALFPDWDIWTQFVFLDQGVALAADSLASTHPIEVSVFHPAEISEIFDKVSYSKGASLIRMLVDFLGEQTFRQGMAHYLKKHAYGNAKTEDLWQALGEVSGRPVGAIMKNWVQKPGYPMVSVKSKSQVKVELIQNRFFSSPISRKRVKDKTIWNIPLGKLLIHQKSVTTTNKREKLNKGESSFIRANYPPEYWQRLKWQVASRRLPAVDRLGLARDAFAMAQAGYLATDEALGFLSSYRDEEDYTVWLSICADLADLRDLIFDQKYYSKFAQYARELLAPIAGKLGWKRDQADEHTRRMLRSLVIYHLGSFGDMATIDKAREFFANIQKGIPANFRSPVYRLTALFGGKKEYDIFKSMYIKENNNQEKERIAQALAEFRDQKLLFQTLEFAMSEKVRLQDATHMITYVAASPYGVLPAWQFIKKNWQELVNRYGGVHFMLPRLILSLATLKEESQARDIEKFFAANPAPGAQRAIAQTVEMIRSRDLWLRRDGKKLQDFFFPMSSSRKRGSGSSIKLRMTHAKN